MRSELDQWLARVGEIGSEDEDAMAERFWPGGEQPVTPQPSLVGDGQGVVITTEVAASIGYRIDGGRWRLYTGPVSVPQDARNEARAVRYGWQESETSSLGR
jgi:hypothetical protein